MWRPVKDKHGQNLDSVLEVRHLATRLAPHLQPAALLKGRALDCRNAGTVCLTAGRAGFQEVWIRQDGDF